MIKPRAFPALLAVISATSLFGISCSGQGDGSSSGGLRTLKFEASSKPLVNPGKGWVVYGGSPKGHCQEALDVCSTSYTRFCWSQLEPEEGKFNWNPIDDAIDAWSDAGKQFSFGVMCESFHSSVKYNTPKWVFDAGLPSIEYDGWKVKGQVAPKNWENPVFLEKLKNFIDAMGKRYDGDPRIAFIDIRSYGQWGEGHLGHLKGSEEISPEGLRKHIQIHLDAFRKTRLMIPWGVKRLDPVYDWAVEQGVGIRRDGILGNSNGSELERCKGKAPSFGEWYFGYGEHAKSVGQYAWGDKLEDRITDDTVRGAMTWQNLGQYDPNDRLVKEHRPYVDKMTNRMGYHFALKELTIPSSVPSGSAFDASFLWTNSGLAFVFIPCKPVAALLDDDGKPVAKCSLKGSEPAKWAPGQETRETATLKFNAAPGSYRLAVGLFSDPMRKSPDILLGMEGERVDGWQLLGRFAVE